MQIKNAKRWARPGAEPYYMALLGYLLAFSVRYTLQPMLDDHLSMFFFAINCVVVAFLYGFWPSFLILLVSIPTAMYFFVQPYSSFDAVSETDLFLLVVYTTLIGLTAAMFEMLRREKYKSDLLVRVSDSRYRLLIEADEDRREIIRKTDC